MSTTSRAPFLLRDVLTKVPAVTAAFWVVKVLTTGMGEAASDWLAHAIDPVIAVALSGLALAVAAVLQLRADRYLAWLYWLTVVLVSIFGTLAADAVHVALGVPYELSAAAFAVVLAVVLLAWRRVEGTLSVHSIHTRRRELFYWTTVGTTFALGTAVGDMTAKNLHLGYLGSGLLFAALFAVPYALHRVGALGPVAAFWWAYIMTRPFGASFADWFGKDRSDTGLGLGDGLVVVAMTLLIVAFVALSTSVRTPDPQDGDERVSAASA